MLNYTGYRFDRELEDMNEKQAVYVIRALESGKIEKLVNKGVMIKVYRYKVSADADIWSYITFRESVNGKQIDYDSDGKHIFWQIWEVKEEITEDLAEKYGFKIELLNPELEER